LTQKIRIFRPTFRAWHDKRRFAGLTTHHRMPTHYYIKLRLSRMTFKYAGVNFLNILSMIFSPIFLCQKIAKSETLLVKNCTKHFHTKNYRAKCWWNWLQVSSLFARISREYQNHGYQGTTVFAFYCLFCLKKVPNPQIAMGKIRGSQILYIIQSPRIT